MNLIFFSEIAGGGAERVATVLAKEFAEEGHNVSIISLKNETDCFEIGNKVKHFIINADENKKYIFLYRIKEISKIIRKEKPERIICLSTIGIYALLAAAIGNSKLILSERSDPNKSMTRISRVIRWINIHVAKRIVFQTRYAEEQYPKHIQKKGVIIPNPISQEMPEIYCGERNNTIVAVGRFITAKNYPLLLRAFENFSLKYPEYRLEIYGNGPKREQVNELVSHSEILKKKLIINNFTTNVYNEILKSAMYVSSSNHEGLSNTMLEALALGIPTICTDCPVHGARDYIEDGVNGILVPIQDVDAMSNAMERIAKGELSNLKIVNNAKLLRANLAVENVAKKWLQIME